MSDCSPGEFIEFEYLGDGFAHTRYTCDASWYEYHGPGRPPSDWNALGSTHDVEVACEGGFSLEYGFERFLDESVPEVSPGTNPFDVEGPAPELIEETEEETIHVRGRHKETGEPVIAEFTFGMAHEHNHTNPN